MNSYTSDTETTFLDLNLSVSNDTITAKIYDERDDFDFNFPFLNGDVIRATFYGLYISKLIGFIIQVNDFNNRSRILTAKFFMQG